MKVAIFADSIIHKGGVERIILAQAKELNADIYVGRYDPDATFEEYKYLNVKTLLKNPKIGYNNLIGRFTTLYIWFLFFTLNLKKKYDAYILHGAGALNAAWRFKPNIWYCHSPSRYLYDLREEEAGRHKGIIKFNF